MRSSPAHAPKPRIHRKWRRRDARARTGCGTWPDARGWSWWSREMDFPLWGGIALLLGWEHWLFVYLGVYAIPYTILALSRRALRIIEAERRAYDPQD